MISRKELLEAIDRLLKLLSTEKLQDIYNQLLHMIP